MRTIVAMLMLSIWCMANEKPALVDKSIQLKNYNQAPSVKQQHRLKLKRLAKISAKEAKDITHKLCNEAVVYQTLTFKGQLLFYLNITKTCVIKINALDGAILSKVHE